MKTGVLRCCARNSAGKGMTLVELMIVVATIGMLAVMGIPAFVKARENSQNGRFVADIRVAADAFVTYSMENGKYPPDVTPGVIPEGMAPYLQRMRWTQPTSLGGRWDWDYRQFGVIAGVSVWSPAAPGSQMLRLDKLIDDGSLTTGSYRTRDSGYISIIEM